MLYLLVDVPFGAYLVPDSREFKETFPFPPVSTVKGMLLSLIGEEDFTKHDNSILHLGFKIIPLKSTIIRTYQRFKVKNINDPQNSRPDFQEILSLIEMAIAIDSSDDPNKLDDKIITALKNSSTVTRYGSLCLGESSHLVNDISIVEKEQLNDYMWLVEKYNGEYRLPVKTVHRAEENNMWRRFDLQSKPPPPS